MKTKTKTKNIDVVPPTGLSDSRVMAGSGNGSWATEASGPPPEYFQFAFIRKALLDDESFDISELWAWLKKENQIPEDAGAIISSKWDFYGLARTLSPTEKKAMGKEQLRRLGVWQVIRECHLAVISRGRSARFLLNYRDDLGQVRAKLRGLTHDLGMATGEYLKGLRLHRRLLKAAAELSWRSGKGESPDAKADGKVAKKWTKATSSPSLRGKVIVLEMKVLFKAVDDYVARLQENVSASLHQVTLSRKVRSRGRPEGRLVKHLTKILRDSGFRRAEIVALIVDGEARRNSRSNADPNREGRVADRLRVKAPPEVRARAPRRKQVG